MGGSQSTDSSGDGTRNVTIETEEGEVDVKLTEDFISHVTKGGDGSPRSGQSRTVTSDNMQSSSAIPSAQEILYGSSDSAPSLQSGKWRDLYEEEKRKNERFQKINDEEFNKGVEEVQNELRQSDLGTLVPLCEENRSKVAQCYSEHPNRTLECSDVVNQYMQCVRQARERQVVQTLNKD